MSSNLIVNNIEVGAGATIYTAASNQLTFGTNGSERLRIGSAGLISIGDESNLDSQLTITQTQGDCIRLRSVVTNNAFKYGIIKQEPYNNNAVGLHIIAGKSDSSYSEVAIGGGVDSGYAATQIDFYTGATTTTATGTRRARINLTGQLLLGPGSLATTKATLAGSLDLSSGGISLCIGGDVNSTGRTNSTDKLNRITAPHYTNAEEPVMMASAHNISGNNTISFGGGSSLCNAATQFKFYTAANTTTTSGTERLRIDSTGRLSLGEANFTASNDVHIKRANSGGDVALRITNNTSTNSGSTASIYFTTSPTQDFNTSYIKAYRSGGKLNFGYATNAPTLTMKVSTGVVGINEEDPDNKLHITTTSSTAYSTNTSNTQNITNALLKLQNLDGNDGGGVNNYVGIQFAVANGATSSAQLNYVRTGDNSGKFSFKARNGNGSVYPNLMDITSAGYIKTPNQPIFMAYRVSNYDITTTATPMVYTEEKIDVGGNYDTSNGRFTAPVDGIYEFGYASIAKNTTTVYRYDLRINGSIPYSGMRQELRYDQSNNSAQYASNGEFCLYIQMTAGQYAQVYVHSDSAASAAYGDAQYGYTYFRGRLIG